MKKNTIEDTRYILAEDMKNYVQVILKEYGAVIPEERKKFLGEIHDYYASDIADKITFARNNAEIDRILRENCGSEVADLFFELSHLMDMELNDKYDHSKFGGVFGPIKKARAYSQIDYSNIYEKLKVFEEEGKFVGANPKKQFIGKIKEYKGVDVSQETDLQHEIGNKNIEEMDIYL